MDSYFKIYREGRGWWRQDCYGYTGDENEAGWWEGSAETLNAHHAPEYDDCRHIPFKPTALQLRLRRLERELQKPE